MVDDPLPVNLVKCDPQPQGGIHYHEAQLEIYVECFKGFRWFQGCVIQNGYKTVTCGQFVNILKITIHKRYLS